MGSERRMHFEAVPVHNGLSRSLISKARMQLPISDLSHFIPLSLSS